MSNLTKVACNLVFEEDLRILPDSYQKILQDIFESMPEAFIRRSASSTMKYHPPYARLQPYGLLLHTKTVVRVVREFLECRPSIQSQLGYDLITAAILHDVTKYRGDKSEHTDSDHDQSAAALCIAAGFPITVQTLVKLHSGRYNSYGYDDDQGEESFYNLIPPEINDEMFRSAVDLLHLADIIASRSFVDINYSGLIFELNKQVGLSVDTLISESRSEDQV